MTTPTSASGRPSQIADAAERLQHHLGAARQIIAELQSAKASLEGDLKDNRSATETRNQKIRDKGELFSKVLQDAGYSPAQIEQILKDGPTDAERRLLAQVIGKQIGELERASTAQQSAVTAKGAAAKALTDLAPKAVDALETRAPASASVRAALEKLQAPTVASLSNILMLGPDRAKATYGEALVGKFTARVDPRAWADRYRAFESKRAAVEQADKALLNVVSKLTDLGVAETGIAEAGQLNVERGELRRVAEGLTTELSELKAALEAGLKMAEDVVGDLKVTLTDVGSVLQDLGTHAEPWRALNDLVSRNGPGRDGSNYRAVAETVRELRSKQRPSDFDAGLSMLREAHPKKRTLWAAIDEALARR